MELKEKLNIKELLKVIFYGFLLTTLVGIVVGYIDFGLYSLIQFSISGLILFLLAKKIAQFLRSNYKEPRTVFSVIIGILLAWMIFVEIYSYAFFIFNDMVPLKDINISLLKYLEAMWPVVIRVVNVFKDFSLDKVVNTLFYFIVIYLGVKETI